MKSHENGNGLQKKGPDDQLHEMMIYVRNDRGVTMPIYVRPDDTVEIIWGEVQHSASITELSLKGKTLHYHGHRLHKNDRVSDLGIHPFSILRLHNKIDPKLSIHDRSKLEV